MDEELRKMLPSVLRRINDVILAEVVGERTVVDDHSEDNPCKSQRVSDGLSMRTAERNQRCC